MPRPTLIERARLYLAKCPPSISGSGGHNAAFAAACALVKGFDLPIGDARSLLHEWNRGCQPHWSEAELEHKLNQATGVPDTQARGYLIGDDRPEHGTAPEVAPAEPYKKPVFDLFALKRFVKGWDEHVDLLWLADRSLSDPATVSTEQFLRMLYGPDEMVVLFDSQHSQGWGVWPHDGLLQEGPEGVWFLAQPVDGQFHPNPRSLKKGTNEPKMSRRSEESVTAFRYLVIESDQAPLRLWLGALAQLPLKIAAIYTSGGRSIHALVRVDCRTKSEWDAEKRSLANGLILLGADPKSMSAVRLTRLPGCWRDEKRALQKLLYINPPSPLRALIEMPVIRATEAHWLSMADQGAADNDETGGKWIENGLRYYAGVSPKCQQRLQQLKQEMAA